MSLTTARTRLRRFRAGDLDRMRELESDAEVMRWTPMRVAQSAEQSLERLQRLIAREPEWAPLGVWAAEDLHGDFVGWFMLKPGDVPELGFMLVQRHWGKGFATEIGAALVAFARSLGHHELVAVADEGNFSSIRVLEKLGFRKTGGVFRLSMNPPRSE